MEIIRMLRPAILQKTTQLIRNSNSISFLNGVYFKGPVRMMSDVRKMVIIPSNFSWTRFKDDFHFYAMLGYLPMGILIFICNVFIGPATLSDIPEDYEPMPWEYYKSPFERFSAHYVHEYPEKVYERTLHLISEEMDKMKMRKLERKVQNMMRDRLDYKAWYYVPVDRQRYETAGTSLREFYDSTGIN